MSTGIRIKEERERLGLTQDEFGALGGVKRLAQSNYEGGKREPGASYFALLKSGGVDVEYIQTGKRTKPIGGNSASLLDVPLLAEVISQLDRTLGFNSTHGAVENGALHSYSLAALAVRLYDLAAVSPDVLEQSRTARQYAEHIAGLVLPKHGGFLDLCPEARANLSQAEDELLSLMETAADLDWQVGALANFKAMLQLVDADYCTESRTEFIVKSISRWRLEAVVEGKVSIEKLRMSFATSADVAACGTELRDLLRQLNNDAWDDKLSEIRLQCRQADEWNTAGRIVSKAGTKEIPKIAGIILNALPALDYFLHTSFANFEPAICMSAWARSDLKEDPTEFIRDMATMLSAINQEWPSPIP